MQTLYLVANPEDATAINLISIAFSFGSMGFGISSALVDMDLATHNRRADNYHVRLRGDIIE